MNRVFYFNNEKLQEWQRKTRRDFNIAYARNPYVHKKPYPNVVKNILLQGTSNNAVVNQFKEAG